MIGTGRVEELQAALLDVAIVGRIPRPTRNSLGIFLAVNLTRKRRSFRGERWIGEGRTRVMKLLKQLVVVVNPHPPKFRCRICTPIEWCYTIL